MKKFYLVCLTVLSFGLTAEVSPERMSQIDSEVQSMSFNELRDRKASLLSEQAQLLDTQSDTQNPSTVKSTSGRLAEIAAELSAIQKVLIGVQKILKMLILVSMIYCLQLNLKTVFLILYMVFQF